MRNIIICLFPILFGSIYGYAQKAEEHFAIETTLRKDSAMNNLYEMDSICFRILVRGFIAQDNPLVAKVYGQYITSKKQFLDYCTKIEKEFLRSIDDEKGHYYKQRKDWAPKVKQAFDFIKKNINRMSFEVKNGYLFFCYGNSGYVELGHPVVPYFYLDKQEYDNSIHFFNGEGIEISPQNIDQHFVEIMVANMPYDADHTHQNDGCFHAKYHLNGEITLSAGNVITDKLVNCKVSMNELKELMNNMLMQNHATYMSFPFPRSAMYK